MEQDVTENRPHLEAVNISGPQLCQMSPGEGAKTIEDLVTRDNRRFDAICEQIIRRIEKIKLAKQRSGEMLNDIDELLGWFREVESQIRESDPPSCEIEVIRVQLKEHKALNDDISSQKGVFLYLFLIWQRCNCEISPHFKTRQINIVTSTFARQMISRTF